MGGIEPLVQKLTGVFLCLARLPQGHLGIVTQRQYLLLAREPICETPEARAVRVHEHEQALEVGDLSRL
jgi:hypothetical protein